MQDKSNEKDEENCQLINKYINNPNSVEAPKEGTGGGIGGTGGGINSQQLYNILNRTRPQQGGRPGNTGSTGGSTSQEDTPPSGQGTGTEPNTFNLSHLRSLLERHTKPTGPSLIEILDPNELKNLGVFENQEILDALKEHLPEGNDSTPETFIQNVRSAQFQQALDVFSYALRHSTDVAGVLLSLGLDPNLAGPNTTIEEFLKALQDMVNQKKNGYR